MKSKFLAVLLGLGLAAGTVGAQQKGTITVGSKLDAEARILGQMIRLVLENDGFKVNDRTRLGPTDITRKALLSGEIDVYPEYTGTAISNFFKGQKIPAGAPSNAALSYATVKNLDKKMNDVEWLWKAPANNTFAIAIPKALADKEKISSVADLAKFVKGGGQIKMVGSQEFFDRDDAFKAFEKTYGFSLKPEQKVVIAGATTAQTESAAAKGTDGANAAMAYGTDGSLAALGLVVLSDPKGAQPVYQPAPIVRGKVLRQYPELAKLLDPVFKTLTEKTLQSLNVQVDLQGKDPTDVARAYLQSKGFIKK